VVPIILLSDKQDSYKVPLFRGDRGVLGYGELEGVSLMARPVFAGVEKVRAFVGVKDIIQPYSFDGGWLSVKTV
jgi:hypothetical protein